MFCKPYRDVIQELVDGTLGPVRRAELQSHLDRCDGCSALLSDLQKIRNAASSLDRAAPPDRVWMQIAGRLRQEGRVTTEIALPRRRHAALLAIAASLVLAVGGSIYLLLQVRDQPASVAQVPAAPADPRPQGPADTRAQSNAPDADPVQSIVDEFRLAEQHLQAGIAKLEQAAQNDPDTIDPQTAEVLKKNREVIDQAIAASRAALNEEPESVPARESLFDALRQKVTLLQDTIALMNEMRKGNSAAAAQIIDGANKS